MYTTHIYNALMRATYVSARMKVGTNTRTFRTWTRPGYKLTDIPTGRSFSVVVSLLAVSLSSRRFNGPSPFS